MGPGWYSNSAPGILPDDVGADDVGRHQVGRELDPGEAQVERLAERADEHRLAQARHALEEDVAARDQRDDSVAQQLLLADDQPAELGFEAGRQLRDLLRVDARLLCDHEAPRLEKYSRTRSRSLPGMRLWSVASRAARPYA